MQNVFRMHHILHIASYIPAPRAGSIIRWHQVEQKSVEKITNIKSVARKWNSTCYQQIALLCRLTAAEQTGETAVARQEKSL